jgi:AhpD family alkylhydroperoxidase
MARIDPVDLDLLPEPARRGYADAMAGRSGPRINIHGTVGHSPDVLVAFVGLANALRNTTELDPRLRELIVVTVSRLRGADYEFAKHWNLALSVGVRRDQLEAIEATAPLEDPAVFDEAEAAVIALAREAVERIRVSDETWAAAARHLDERQMIEALLHIGMYSMTAQLTEAVQMDVEPWFERR